MSKIRVLPVAQSRGGEAHITDLLTAALAEGRDLGSRVPHMRLLARSLEGLAQRLEEDLRALHRDLEACNLGPSEDLARLDRLVCDVRKLVDITDALPVDPLVHPGSD